MITYFKSFAVYLCGREYIIKEIFKSRFTLDNVLSLCTILESNRVQLHFSFEFYKLQAMFFKCVESLHLEETDLSEKNCVNVSWGPDY